MNFVEDNGKKIAAVLCVASCFPVIATVYAMETAPGWHGDKYINEDSTVAKGWQEIEGKSWYFSEEDGTVDTATTRSAVVASVSSSAKDEMKAKAEAAITEQAAQEAQTQAEAAPAEQTAPVEAAAPAAEVPAAPAEEIPVANPAPEVTEATPAVAETAPAPVEATPVVVETETVTAEPEYTEAAPAEPEYTEPAPAEPEYTEPAPAEPEYTEPAPAEPEYTEPAPAEPEYTEPAPAEPEYTEPAPAEPEYTEPAPTEPEYTEPAPANPAPAQPDANGDLNASIANAALGLVGTTDGWQCTAVATEALNQAGVSAGVVWPDQYIQYGYYVDPSQAQAGNLIYYDNGGRGVDHIAVYIGDGQAVHGNFDGQTIIGDAYLSTAGTPQFIQVVQ